ncbi:hypothetical protein BDV24DRAFT_158921 [Aspergillus arachidicola]|uniref:Aldehyde dehydrogenase domain-containing protein n=1 Tax=Aspergillus arachidicola TaxID=656916 RepID=A0A2G7G2J0_9EURO|nr:hypothetical protein BDV24DRAFT_158921 [Aspergillus arachidicola]PIG87077.1 hypothetical protein AARAC_004308 [Aspergillus arachidicola]
METRPSSRTALPVHLAAIFAGKIDGRTENVRYRQQQFHRLHKAIITSLTEIKEALVRDSGHQHHEVQAELHQALREITTHYRSLNLEEAIGKEYRVAHGQDNRDGRRGVGIVYIIPGGHNLFYSLVACISAAVAAGNCIVVELPRTTLQLPELLRRVLSNALDRDTFTFTEERPDATVLQDMFVVCQDQSNSTELGSQLALVSPNGLRTVAVVDRTAQVEVAAQELGLARFLFRGQSPYAPDLVLVNEFCVEQFLEALLKYAAKGLGLGRCDDVPAVPRRGKTPSQLDRLSAEEGTQVVVSGSDWGIAIVHDRHSTLLSTKINERLLLIHTVTSLDDAINFCNSTSTLAATYTFSAPAAAKYVSESIDAHLSWINHIPYDMLVGPVLPAQYPLNTETRYTVEMFEVPRPQIISPTASTMTSASILKRKGIDAQIEERIQAPLPALQQRPGHRVGFFEQGLISGGLVALTPLAGFVLLGAYRVFSTRK